MSALGNGRTSCTDCGCPLGHFSRTAGILGLCPTCAAEPPLSIQCGTPRCNAEIASGDRLDADDAGWVYSKEAGEWECRPCYVARHNAEAPPHMKVKE